MGSNRSLDNLAMLYQAQGKYAEAEPLYVRVLAILEKALGPEHPDLAESLKNYAALLQKMGREAEAAKMEARALAIRKPKSPYHLEKKAALPNFLNADLKRGYSVPRVAEKRIKTNLREE